jgi:hypothetical protein
MRLPSILGTTIAAAVILCLPAEAAERRCRSLGTKAFKVRDIRVDGTSCRQGRALGQSYAALATDEPELRRSGRSDINGYTCEAHRERRRPLRLVVRCTPAPQASPEVVPARGQVRFLILARSEG